MPVHFFSQELNYSLNNPTKIKEWISDTFSAEDINKDIELNIIFLSDQELLQINQDFLKHDYYTDIITFPIEEDEESLEAELYISIDRIKDNATQQNIPFSRELNRVIIHGVLHLSGYGDKTPEEEKTMRSKEDFYLSKLS